MDEDRYLKVVFDRLEELVTMPAILQAAALSAIRVDLKDFLSDVPTGQIPSAENLRCIRAEGCEYRDSIIHEADGHH